MSLDFNILNDLLFSVPFFIGYTNMSAFARAALVRDISQEQAVEIERWRQYESEKAAEDRTDNLWTIVGSIVGGIVGFAVGGPAAALAGWGVGSAGAKVARYAGVGPDQFDEEKFLEDNKFLMSGKFNRYQDVDEIKAEIDNIAAEDLADQLDIAVSLVSSAISVVTSVGAGGTYQVTGEEWRKGIPVDSPKIAELGLDPTKLNRHGNVRIPIFKRMEITASHLTKSELEKYSELKARIDANVAEAALIDPTAAIADPLSHWGNATKDAFLRDNDFLQQPEGFKMLLGQSDIGGIDIPNSGLVFSTNNLKKLRNELHTWMDNLPDDYYIPKWSDKGDDTVETALDAIGHDEIFNLADPLLDSIPSQDERKVMQLPTFGGASTSFQPIVGSKDVNQLPTSSFAPFENWKPFNEEWRREQDKFMWKDWWQNREGLFNSVDTTGLIERPGYTPGTMAQPTPSAPLAPLDPNPATDALLANPTTNPIDNILLENNQEWNYDFYIPLHGDDESGGFFFDLEDFTRDMGLTGDVSSWWSPELKYDIQTAIDYYIDNPNDISGKPDVSSDIWNWVQNRIWGFEGDKRFDQQPYTGSGGELQWFDEEGQ